MVPEDDLALDDQNDNQNNAMKTFSQESFGDGGQNLNDSEFGQGQYNQRTSKLKKSLYDEGILQQDDEQLLLTNPGKSRHSKDLEFDLNGQIQDTEQSPETVFQTKWDPSMPRLSGNITGNDQNFEFNLDREIDDIAEDQAGEQLEFNLEGFDNENNFDAPQSDDGQLRLSIVNSDTEDGSLRL